MKLKFSQCQRAILVLLVMTITVVPYVRVKVGPIPIYAVDVVTAIALWLVWRQKLEKQEKFWQHSPNVALLTGTYVSFVVLTALHEIWLYGVFLEPIYLLTRNLLSVTPIFLISHLWRDETDLKSLSKSLIVGLLMTSVVTIAFSLPGIGSVIRSTLFQIGWLFPPRIGIAAEIEVETVVRGSSLYGGTNPTGCALMVFFGLVYGIARSRGLINSLWQKLALIGLVLTPFAVLMTYSRGAYLSLFLVAAVMVWRSYAGSRRLVTAISLILVLTIVSVGASSDYFYFERITERNISLDESEVGASERARIRAYTKLVPFLRDNPRWIFVGAGDTAKKLTRRGRVSKRDLVLSFSDGRIHSFFAAVFYNRGLGALLSSVLLIAIVFVRSEANRRQAYRLPASTRWLSYVLPLVFVAIVPSILTEHFFVTSIPGHGLLFLILGLTVANTRAIERYRHQRSPSPSVPVTDIACQSSASRSALPPT